MNPKKYDGLVGYQTYYARIKKGWDEDAAKNTPTFPNRKLQLDEVMKIEAHELSLNASAYLLGVSVSVLSVFIKRNNITWRGKKACFMRGEIDTNSMFQKVKQLGLAYNTIKNRMRLYEISFDDAVKMSS